MVSFGSSAAWLRPHTHDGTQRDRFALSEETMVIKSGANHQHRSELANTRAPTLARLREHTLASLLLCPHVRVELFLATLLLLLTGWL